MTLQLDSRIHLAPKSMDVLARVAHEMRQPLSAATAAVTIMTRDGDAGRRAQACHVLERQCARLSRLLEDLLVVARLGNDVTTLKAEDLDLGRLLLDLSDAFRPLVGVTGHQLDVVCPPRDCWVHGDAIRLDQVFSNILTNAIKFTNPSGPIWVRAVATEGNAIVTIGDTGRGIAPDVLPHVFEMFTTGPDSAERGLGIGLAVARHIVDLHGGSIDVASEGDGRGTEVTVTLPRLRSHRRDEPGDQPEQ
jgi:signal transduction histidine kinase